MNEKDEKECEVISAASGVLARREQHCRELAKISDPLGTQANKARDYERARHHLHDELSERYERDRFIRKKYGD